jgi:type II restriction enzyme
LGLGGPAEAFDFLTGTLRESIRFWDYFVNWRKAIGNAEAISEMIAKWDTLIGCENFDGELAKLISANPAIVMTIPILAVRDGSNTSVFQIADNPANPLGSIRTYDFSRPADTKELQDNAIHFLTMSGLKDLLRKHIRGSLNDYVLGVEAGLDSNGRKNRGGTAMESAVRQHIAEICLKFNLRFMEQATDARMSDEWGKPSTHNPGRRYDFAIDGPRGLIIIEVNFYSAGGSKLKATAGEYKELAPRLTGQGFTFVWITDGQGWRTAKAPLKSAFMDIEHVFNLELLAEGCLIDLISPRDS